MLNKPNLRNKEIAFCFGLLFGVGTYSSYVDIAKMYINSCDVEIKKFKIL